MNERLIADLAAARGFLEDAPVSGGGCLDFHGWACDVHVCVMSLLPAPLWGRGVIVATCAIMTHQLNNSSQGSVGAGRQAAC